jgi:hypothetical protein
MNELLKPPLGVGQTQPPPAQWANNVAYSDSSLAADLARLSDSWRHVQSSRRRDAIFSYMTDVFELVRWWAFEKQADERAARALALKGLAAPTKIEPYRAVIVASVAPQTIDKRTVSKWSRALRFAAAYKPHKKRLRRFIKSQGGINACASAYSRWLRRRQFRFCKE